MKLEKYCSKQLAKSESLLLFVVLKTNLEPRMIFTCLKACLKKKKKDFSTETIWGPQSQNYLLGGPVPKKKKKKSLPIPLLYSTELTSLIFVLENSAGTV